MKIIAISVCVNYADLFRIALKTNAGLLDHIYVVTTPDDIHTQDLCKLYSNITLIVSHSIHKNNAKFNKSAMVREAQDIVHKQHANDWIVLLDADIVLPECFKEKFNKDMGKTSLYSIPRVDYHNLESYMSKCNGKKYPYKFMGYAQIYHDKTKIYPESSTSCAVCDEIFSKQFLCKCELTLGEPCAHLGQEKINWDGRKSPLWEAD